MNNIPYKRNIQFKKDYLKDLLVDSYKVLWQKNSQTILKFNALNFIAQHLDEEEVRERLVYLYDRENNRRIKRVMQSIIDGTYIMYS
jgi:hypothetical protein